MAARIRQKKSASTTSEPAKSNSTTPATGSSSAAQPAAATTSTTVIRAAPWPSHVAVPNLPPADANIPAPSSDFVPGDAADYRAVLPRDAELRALTLAVKDIGNFTDYAQVFGATAPPYDEVSQALTVANAWSSMRTRTAAWDAFCNAQEGLSWTALRLVMSALQGPFDSAVASGTKLNTTFTGLSALLGAKKVIARKGVSTRKANQQAEAEGTAPTHGRVGKARKRRAEKAAYATQAENAGGATAATSATQSGSPATSTPSAQGSAPMSSSPAAVPSTAPGTPSRSGAAGPTA